MLTKTRVRVASRAIETFQDFCFSSENLAQGMANQPQSPIPFARSLEGCLPDLDNLACSRISDQTFAVDAGTSALPRPFCRLLQHLSRLDCASSCPCWPIQLTTRISQNPPSIPTLVVAQFICYLRAARLAIDWHNLGYSILALKLGSKHPFVYASSWYEEIFGQWASVHFTVTDAMAQVLRRRFALNSPVLALHDRPSHRFQAIASKDRLACLQSLPIIAKRANDILDGTTRLLVSSTSWTPDEDFSVLIEALSQYSGKATTTHPQLPEIFVIITGKGPQRTTYTRRMEQLKDEGKLEMVTITTTWLSFDDYAKLLAVADLGVSLHTSSSGLDLPMKVVDMFGAGLPVLGWSKFVSWPELVTEGVDGLGFVNADEMTDRLVDLFTPENPTLAKLKVGALLQGSRRWDHEWDEVAGRWFGLVLE